MLLEGCAKDQQTAALPDFKSIDVIRGFTHMVKINNWSEVSFNNLIQHMFNM